MSACFRENFPNSKLFEFLDKICLKKDKYYVFDINSFKKLLYNPIVYDEFVNTLKPYYYNSYAFYLERPITYNNVTTILRQLCKQNALTIIKKLTYSKHDYNNNYYIYYD